MAEATSPVLPVSMGIPFQAGITLNQFILFDATARPGDIVKLRLSWQLAEIDQLVTGDVPMESIIVFAQLLDQGSPAQNIAQNDRRLIDWQNLAQSPLLPGQVVQQGYGLSLPDNLPSGSYPLVIGLYRATTGQRLYRIDNNPDDFIYLANVVVE